MPARPDDPTPRQLLIAAQRMIAGDPAPLAAALANIRLDALRAAMQGEEWQGIRAGWQQVHDLSHGDWLGRMEDIACEALERGLVDGHAGCVGAVLKSSAVLVPAPLAEMPEEAEDGCGGPPAPWEDAMPWRRTAGAEAPLNAPLRLAGPPPAGPL